MTENKEALEIDQLAQLLPDLEVKQAILRMGGKPEFFKKMLRIFIKEYAFESLADIVAKIEAGHLEDAITQVHTLKSISGSLGAPLLQSKMAEIEASLKQNQQIPSKLYLAADQLFKETFNTIRLALENSSSQISHHKIEEQKKK